MGFKAGSFRGGGGRGGRLGGRIPMRLIIIVVLGGLGWLAKEGYLGPLGAIFDQRGGGGGGGPSSQGGSYQKDFVTLEGAELSSDRGNDGDSFMVRHDGERYHLRLYYMDTPEKYVSNHNEERVMDQARYWGISKNETVELGQESKDYVLKLLGSQEFTVHTHWEPVYNSERYYGFIELGRDGNDGDYLIERLADAGLARIHTKGVDTPDGVSERRFERELQDRENRAKKARAGGWGR